MRSTHLGNVESTDDKPAFGVIRNRLAELNEPAESPVDSEVTKHCLQCNFLVDIFHKSLFLPSSPHPDSFAVGLEQPSSRKSPTSIELFDLPNF